MSGVSASQRVSAGLMWNTAFTFSKDALQFGLTLVLARLLTPEIYGQFSVVSSITTFAAAISFRNFLAHSLQLRSDEPVDYHQHASFGLVVQAGLFFITNCVALGLWYSSMRPIAIPLAVMSPLLFIDIPSEMCSRMLERELKWSTLRLLNIVGFVFGSVVSLGLALSGAGIYALLVPNLVFPLPVVFHLVHTRQWRFSWRWVLNEYSSTLRFGVARLFSGLFGQARGVLESTVIATLLSFSVLGIYGRAIGLSQLFIYRFIFLLMSSAYPVLTTVVAGTGNSQRARVLLLRAICWGSAAAGLFLSFGAPSIIKLLYGHQWIDAIPLVGAAVASRIAAGHRYAVTSLLLADNQARRCVWLDGLSLAAFVATLPALTVSVRMFLYADAAVQAVVSVFGLWWLSRSAITLFRDTVLPMLEAALVAIGVYVPLRFAIPVTEGVVARLALGAAAGLIFFMIVRVMFSRATFELVQLLPFSAFARRLFVFRTPDYLTQA
jgi:O-antigen/teichoic acid export membrane protein